mmetsp:Transcript_19118/g.32129  ORF Transcript_19118/g.32129 Transcript_19118/m.32129 type:complete len:278 (+) Transcript_19118:233-1066(+)
MSRNSLVARSLSVLPVLRCTSSSNPRIHPSSSICTRYLSNSISACSRLMISKVSCASSSFSCSLRIICRRFFCSLGGGFSPRWWSISASSCATAACFAFFEDDMYSSRIRLWNCPSATSIFSCVHFSKMARRLAIMAANFLCCALSTCGTRYALPLGGTTGCLKEMPVSSVATSMFLVISCISLVILLRRRNFSKAMPKVIRMAVTVGAKWVGSSTSATCSHMKEKEKVPTKRKRSTTSSVLNSCRVHITCNVHCPGNICTFQYSRSEMSSHRPYGT